MPWFFYQSAYISGSDFQAFWAAARIFVSLDAISAYKLALQSEVQQSLPAEGFFAFVHPPPFLLLIAPLGWLNYPAALATWNATTFASWALASTMIDRRAGWSIAAFPGALLALAHGQIGLMCGALICGSVAASKRFPYLAGALIGMLVIKPQIALLLPLVVVLARQPKIFIGAALSALAFLLLPLVLFGTSIYEAFAANLTVTSGLIAEGEPVFLQRMCSVYAAIRLLASEPAAMAVQAATALGGTAFIFWAARRTLDFFTLCAIAVTVTCITLPYLFSYDLPFLILPLIWIGVQGHRDGWLAWEKLLLAVAYWGVLLCRAVAIPIGTNPTPLLAMLLIWMIWRRLSTGTVIAQAAGTPLSHG